MGGDHASSEVLRGTAGHRLSVKRPVEGHHSGGDRVLRSCEPQTWATGQHGARRSTPPAWTVRRPPSRLETHEAQGGGPSVSWETRVPKMQQPGLRRNNVGDQGACEGTEREGVGVGDAPLGTGHGRRRAGTHAGLSRPVPHAPGAVSYTHLTLPTTPYV